MLTEIIKVVFEMIKRRKEETHILILTKEEIEKIDLSPLKEAKKEFDIYIGKDKIN